MQRQSRWIIVLAFFLNTVFAVEPSTQPTSTTPPSIRFLTLADIHFDPFVSCGLTQPCPLVMKLNQAAPAQWPRIFSDAGVRISQIGEDTSYPLFHSALLASKKVAETARTQFVLVVGDSLGHNFRSQYRKYSGDTSRGGAQNFLYNTLVFITAQLQAAYPNQSIYMVVGNNDSYQGDYVSGVNGSFFRDTSSLWSGLIRDASARTAMQKQFVHAGYYSVMLPQSSDLRLIVLNTNFFSYKGKGKNLHQQALEQLDWLHQTLQQATQAHQKVLIAMHIPEGIDVNVTQRMRLLRLITLWKQEYITRFDAELKEAAPVIAGLFVGHLHLDWLQMMSFPSGNEIPVKGVASISPIFGNNPGFEVDTYALQPVQWDSAVTYAYPLSGAGEWRVQKERAYR